jgi:hypothetical protein
MSLLFGDSFDHYVTADLPIKYDSTPGSNFTINAAAGRNSTAGFRNSGNSNQTPLKKAIPNLGTVIIGFSLDMKGSFPASTTCLLAFRDNTTFQVTIAIGTDGKVRVYRGNIASGTLLGTSTNSISNTGHHYVEVKVKIDPSVGTVEFRYDNVALIALTGQNTRTSANSFATNILFCSVEDGTTSYSLSACDIDDLYICDSAGSVNNDFLGDVRVECLFPTGAGNYAQFTPSTGSNHTCVDETAQNGDTDTVSSATVGNIDSYAYGNPTPSSGSVKGVIVTSVAKKDDGGSRLITGHARLSSTDLAGADISLGNSYKSQQTVLETKPGGGAWSLTDVANAEFGVKVTG